MNKKNLFVVGLIALGFTLGACGEEDTTDTPAPIDNSIKITVSGNLLIHPVSAGIAKAGVALGAPAPSFGSAFQIDIVDPVAVLGDPVNFPVLGTVTIDDTNCIDSSAVPGDKYMRACPFTVSGVDISGLTLGMVALLTDTRPETEQQFVFTNAGVFGSTTLGALKVSGADYTTAALLAVTNTSTNVMASKTNGAYTANQMITNGFLFGLVLDNADAAVAAPASGVTVAEVMAEGASAKLDIYHLNDTLTDVSMTGTGAPGFFFAVAKPDGTSGLPASVLGALNFTGGTQTYSTATAGTAPGGVFSFVVYPDAAMQ